MAALVLTNSERRPWSAASCTTLGEVLESVWAGLGRLIVGLADRGGVHGRRTISLRCPRGRPRLVSRLRRSSGRGYLMEPLSATLGQTATHPPAKRGPGVWRSRWREEGCEKGRLSAYGLTCCGAQPLPGPRSARRKDVNKRPAECVRARGRGAQPLPAEGQGLPAMGRFDVSV